jgi:hypothetical protein
MNGFPSNESGCVAMPIATTVAKAKGETRILIFIELLIPAITQHPTARHSRTRRWKAMPSRPAERLGRMGELLKEIEPQGEKN